MHVHCGVAPRAVRRRRDGEVDRPAFADGDRTSTPTWSCSPPASGPATSWPAQCGLESASAAASSSTTRCRRQRPDMCARSASARSHGGRVYGLVAPGYEMAEVVADRLVGGDADVHRRRHVHQAQAARRRRRQRSATRTPRPTAPTRSSSTTRSAASTRSSSSTPTGRAARRHARRRRLGVRHAPAAMTLGAPATPDDPPALTCPPAPVRRAAVGVGALPDDAQRLLVQQRQPRAPSARPSATGATTSARSRRAPRPAPAAAAASRSSPSCSTHELTPAGVSGRQARCASTSPTPASELFELVRDDGVTSFAELSPRPRDAAAAARSASRPSRRSSPRSSNGYILDGEQAALQDTNDHFLANIQTRRHLLGRAPRARRRDHAGAADRASARSPGTSTSTRRSPAASASTCSAPASSSCRRSGRGSIDAGFESGHAYGKALRTVKSCVGSTWCRYGVQDSVGMAIQLELRYRGLRSPHKIKMAVSGCARECAEAQSKDVGVIATENGWNLYVGGNGGARPAPRRPARRRPRRRALDPLRSTAS